MLLLLCFNLLLIVIGDLFYIDCQLPIEFLRT